MEAWGFCRARDGCVLQFKAPKMDFLRKCLCVGTTPSWTAQPPSGVVIPLHLPVAPLSWKSPCQPMWFPAVSPTQLLLSPRFPLRPHQPLQGLPHCSPSLHCPPLHSLLPHLSKLKFASDFCGRQLGTHTYARVHTHTHTHTHSKFFFFLSWLANQHSMPGSLPSFSLGNPHSAFRTVTSSRKLSPGSSSQAGSQPRTRLCIHSLFRVLATSFNDLFRCLPLL